MGVFMESLVFYTQKPSSHQRVRAAKAACLHVRDLLFLYSLNRRLTPSPRMRAVSLRGPRALSGGLIRAAGLCQGERDVSSTGL